MNPISAWGHSTLWKKHARNQSSPSSTSTRRDTPRTSPLQVIDKNQALCSPRQICDNIQPDTPKSIASESLESIHETEQSDEKYHETSSASVMTLEECLEEKVGITRVLAERAKLGPFLLESTERPVIDNKIEFKESAEAIRHDSRYKSRSHLSDNIESLKKDYTAYDLNDIDILAIRLYTTAISYVVNEALRNYSLYDTPVPPIYQPYIYALLNAFVKLDRDRVMNEARGYHFGHWSVTRYIAPLSPAERQAMQPVLDLHQPGTYVMYPGFTSASVADQAKRLWSDGFECRFEIKALTAIKVEDFAVHSNEYEAVFSPGAIFRVLEREDPYFEIEEVLPQNLQERLANLPC
ncbi:unnamed protein product [Adineta ricciae]|uniref:NAD(P)(+)--arginine ADP-ribosyltransferase n=1 Tax=Adineta ricciae TaxID=249248 RepID=A0A815UXD9_ADIRI|nr:unnamed protein product [Adineta ricciae]CAF1524854.1 unnamed protein product [Adineta ricciae]